MVVEEVVAVEAEVDLEAEEAEVKEDMVVARSQIKRMGSTLVTQLVGMTKRN